MPQVMRIATFHTRPDVDSERYAAFSDWMAAQPGLRALYHAHDPVTGHFVSVSVWDSRASLGAMRDRVPPGGPLGIKPDATAIYDVATTGGPGILAP